MIELLKKVRLVLLTPKILQRIVRFYPLCKRCKDCRDYVDSVLKRSESQKNFANRCWKLSNCSLLFTTLQFVREGAVRTQPINSSKTDDVNPHFFKFNNFVFLVNPVHDFIKVDGENKRHWNTALFPLNNAYLAYCFFLSELNVFGAVAADAKGLAT